jgi:2-amino-4-hydroxy-6-hydroxymethyldihydropteridine diphosphokinase
MNYTAYLSIGSNIGNKIKNCQDSIKKLNSSGSTFVKKCSLFYKSEPVDYIDQEWFINAVIKCETTLDPFQLLRQIKSLEQQAGRINDSVRFGPRVLDLDIILYEDTVIKSSMLNIPHKRMHKRCFVLQPLCDIAPDLVHPVFKKKIKYLLSQVNNQNQKIIPLNYGVINSDLFN